MYVIVMYMIVMYMIVMYVIVMYIHHLLGCYGLSSIADTE